MTEEYKKLQKLIKENIVEISLKKSIKDIFGIWLYWYGKENPNLLNLWGKLFYLYWIISSEWLWIPLSIVLSIRYESILSLFLILIPLILTRILKPIGQDFMICDAKNNEKLFEELWENRLIGILSIEKKSSLVHKKGTPTFIIDSHNKNWRTEILDI